MNKIKYIKTALLTLLCTVILTGSNLCIDKVTAETLTPTNQKIQTSRNLTPPLLIVNSPKLYLNQTIEMEGKFDKFSTLGLDYKSAFKSSEEYISFLIKRDDTVHDIPLSEMKLFLKREEAEKHIDLKTNDKIYILGTVFSDALGDAWIDVQKLELIEKAPEKKDGV